MSGWRRYPVPSHGMGYTRHPQTCKNQAGGKQRSVFCPRLCSIVSGADSPASTNPAVIHDRGESPPRLYSCLASSESEYHIGIQCATRLLPHNVRLTLPMVEADAIGAPPVVLEKFRVGVLLSVPGPGPHPGPHERITIVFKLMSQEFAFISLRRHGKEAPRTDQVPRVIVLIVPMSKFDQDLVAHKAPPPWA